MAKVALKNRSAWAHLKGIKEATDSVSKWPAWKRDAIVFTKKVETKEIVCEKKPLPETKK
jgi:hypothetical protein